MRQRILDVAADKYYRFGFSRVTVDELVEELRTSKSMIYRHFRSKEEIVRALLLRVNNEINRKLESVVNDPDRVFSDKLEAITVYTGQLLSRVGEPFLEDLRTQLPGLWEQYLDMRRERLEQYYLRLINEGVSQGELRNDIDPEFMLLVYTKLTELAVDPSAFQAFPITGTQAYQWISSLFVKGAQKP